MSWWDPTSWFDSGSGGGSSLVNSQGSTLSVEDAAFLTGGNWFNQITGKKSEFAGLTPEQRAIDMRNWLTAGGPPKPIDPSQIFMQDQIISPVLAKSAAGAGINGLFGIGKTIGDLQPLNLSPMQPGVPYSALPLPGGR